MDHILLSCLETEIQQCNRCNAINEIAGLMEYAKPLTFYGSSNPKIMLVGHSPAVRSKSKAGYVLKMNQPKLHLYKYIIEMVLTPLNIDISELYCTNLIKCLTKGLPEDIDKNIGFFEKAFTNCKILFEKEIDFIKPDLIISLSERVLKLLSKTYMGEELKMKEVFGKLLDLNIGRVIPYIPVVHIPKGKNSKVALHYFPEQINRLRELRGSWRN